jgi:hypothetical protein
MRDFLFQKSPAQTAFWTFIWTNPKVAQKVAMSKFRQFIGE